MIAEAPRITTVIGPRTGLTGKPLVVLMHGYGADENDLLGMLVELGIGTTDERFDWISVRAPLTLPDGGYAWFPIDDVAAAADPAASVDKEIIDASLAALLAVIDQHAPDVPIIPMGFSQGAFMASEVLRQRPEQVLAAVMCSGFVYPEGYPKDAELAARKIPVFFGWGELDDSPIPREAFPMSADWVNEYTDATVRSYPELAHAISATEITDIKDFLAR